MLITSLETRLAVPWQRRVVGPALTRWFGARLLGSAGGRTRAHLLDTVSEGELTRFQCLGGGGVGVDQLIRVLGVRVGS